MKKIQDTRKGFTMVEVMVALILLILSFMVFLQALNTGKTVRAHSELRTVQSVILNSMENQIRAPGYDENSAAPWSSSLGKDSGETSINHFDDIDDFHQYTINEVSEYPAFGISVAVTYVSASSGFHTPHNNQTDYKSVMVKVTHKTLSAITDTMIISPGL